MCYCQKCLSWHDIKLFKCCLFYRASVLPVQDEFYIDDASVKTGPLTKTVCVEEDIDEDDGVLNDELGSISLRLIGYIL